jgi:5'-nucleotidase
MIASEILLTNDDGIRSPGLAAAARALSALGELTVIAPLRQQTAMGRAHAGNPDATLVESELEAEGRRPRAFACDASPAAALAHGFRVFEGYRPSLVVSGINYGENLGANITSSGTVGAAFEAAVRGIPALAVSLETDIESHYEYGSQNWDAAMHFLQLFARRVLGRGLPGDVHVLKIDVPACATAETPWRLTRLSPYPYYEARIDSPSLASRLRDARVSKRRRSRTPSDTDVWALSMDKVVSVTPLSLDLTSRAEFSAIHAWLEGE